MYLVNFEMRVNPEETILEHESINFCLLFILSEYAVFSACADNGHLLIEIIKVLPPIPIIFNSVLAQKRLSVL